MGIVTNYDIGGDKPRGLLQRTDADHLVTEAGCIAEVQDVTEQLTLQPIAQQAKVR